MLDYKLAGVITGGLITALLLSPSENWKLSVGGLCGGLVLAIVGPEPTAHWLALDEELFKYALAGFYAIFGDRIIKRGYKVIDETSLPWRSK